MGSYRICVICNYKGAQVAFVLFIIIMGLKSHVCYLYLYRGSCSIFVFVLFVFIKGLMLHLCYLYL